MSTYVRPFRLPENYGYPVHNTPAGFLVVKTRECLTDTEAKNSSPTSIPIGRGDISNKGSMHEKSD